MKICSGDKTPCGYSMPVIMTKEYNNYCSKATKELIGGVGEVGKGLLGLTKKELRKLKRKEKENLWKRNNRRNAQPEPLVVHLPKETPVSPVRSALQTVHKESAKAREHHCYQGGLNHDWVGYYDKGVTSDQSCINEWNAMEGLESKRPPSPDSLTNKEETELLIRSKLKEIMMSVDIDEVTSKYIRQRLEEDLKMDLFKFKSFIDQEMLTILGQMDAATEIFPHVYLGSEWNASNLEELKTNGVGFILNVTKEIDNFYPGMFDYLNIRVYDDEKTELLRHWDDTYKYISQVKEKGSKVLVHCKMGISRSASVVIAYAMKARNLNLIDATELVKKKRGCIKPNQAFTSQLKIYQGILDASRQRHNALFRSKSETNLKSSGSSGTTPTGGGNHMANMKFNYAPRGMQVMPIPDFKPRSSSSTTVAMDLGNLSNHSKESSPKHLQPSPTAPPSVDLTTLHVPLLANCRRPRSWSPDEEAAKMLNLPPYQDSDFGESLQKSRSLNDQAWQAHVTVVQRDLRDPGGGLTLCGQGEGYAEALNPPVWGPRTTPSSPSSSQRFEEVQLSSSVKERINEFESVTSSVPLAGSGASAKSAATGAPTGGSLVRSPSTNSSKRGGTSPFLGVTLSDVTTTESSTDYHGSDPEVDDVVEFELDVEITPPLNAVPPPTLSSSVVTTIPSVIACAIITTTTSSTSSSSDSPSSTTTSPPQGEKMGALGEGASPEGSVVPETEGETAVGVRNEGITWPAGLVRKQKEDFEGKVHTPIPSGGPTPALYRQGSSHSLGGRSSSPSPKDDPFSIKVDRVFDREERNKDHKGSKNHTQQPAMSQHTGVSSYPEGKRENTPSRNNSWGSFDSAVVLPDKDRDVPSRQSSWGSCDTRLSGGSLLSRNSSGGGFDSKLSTTAVPTLYSQVQGCTTNPGVQQGCTLHPQVQQGCTLHSGVQQSATSPNIPQEPTQNYIGYCVDKDGVLPSARRSKVPGGIANKGVGLTTSASSGLLYEEGCHGDEALALTSRGVPNVRAYGPLPFFKSQPEKESTEEEQCESPATPGTRDLEGKTFFIGAPPTVSQRSGPAGGGVKRSLKTSPQTPEHEIPLPGTVKQQMQKLQNRVCQKDHSVAGENLSAFLLNVPQPSLQPATSIGRSLSSGCVCTVGSGSNPTSKKITRSSSEKRAKTHSEGGTKKGNVRKITKALEDVRHRQRQNHHHFPDSPFSSSTPDHPFSSSTPDHPFSSSAPDPLSLPTNDKPFSSSTHNHPFSSTHDHPFSSSTHAPFSSSTPDSETRLPSSSSSLRRTAKRERPDLVLPRSQSLERLGGPGPPNSSSGSPPTPNKRLSADQRQMVSSQNFLDQLVTETQAQVHQLEKAQEEINVRNLVGLFEDPAPLRRKIRPRSESMGERDLPPVPQRKSSLDYTFRPVSLPTGLASPGAKTSSHTLTNGGAQKTLSGPPKLPQPPQGCSRACGSEVRRKKQQGKTHPLSKLTPREKTL